MVVIESVLDTTAVITLCALYLGKLTYRPLTIQLAFCIRDAGGRIAVKASPAMQVDAVSARRILLVL